MSKSKYLDLAGLTVYDGKIKEWIKSGIIDITDDMIRVLFVVPEPEIPNNEIWYYTDDNNVVNLQGFFGDVSNSITNAKLVSNTYENGKGVLQFDSDVTSINSVDHVQGERVSGFHFCYASPNLTKLILPKTVVRLEDYAFRGEGKLECIEVNLNSIQYIGDSCFSGTNLAESVLSVLPSQFNEIGKYWFASNGCSSLIIPDHINSIGESAFAYCDSLETIDLSNVTSIGESAFTGCSSIITITIPESVESIGGSAFKDCSSLTSVVIGNGVTSIGGGAFYNCSSLSSVTIPESVTSIGQCAFYECSSLASVVIPDGVTSIEGGAFGWCSSLTSINIPNSATSIGDGAFYYCEELETITIPISVISIDKNAFGGCDKLAYIIYEGTTEQWNSVYKYRTETGDWLGGCGTYQAPWTETRVPATYVQCTNGQVPIDKSQIQ